MMLVISVLLIASGCAGVAYLWGCHVGLTQGVKAGRAAADAEWAVYMEHGAIGPV